MLDVCGLVYTIDMNGNFRKRDKPGGMQTDNLQFCLDQIKHKLIKKMSRFVYNNCNIKACI